MLRAEEKALGAALALCLAAMALAGCSRPGWSQRRRRSRLWTTCKIRCSLPSGRARGERAGPVCRDVGTGGRHHRRHDGGPSERNLYGAWARTLAIIGTVKSPNAEKILELQPDLVLLSADIEGACGWLRRSGDAQIPCAFSVDCLRTICACLGDLHGVEWPAGICTEQTALLGVQRRVQRDSEGRRHSPRIPRCCFCAR